MVSGSRRQFIGFLSVGALAAMSGTAGASHQDVDDEYHAAPTWVGLEADRPSPNIFNSSDSGEVLYFATDTGQLSHLHIGDNSWSVLPVTLPNYTTTELPNDLSEGSVIHDSNRGTVAWWDGDNWEFPAFVDDVLTSPVTVANTTTRTQVWDPDINAMSLLEGRIYQIDLHGTYSTANTSDQFTVDINLAGTDVAELQNAAANADPGTPWTLELTFTVRSDGTNGSVKPNSRATFNEQPRTASHGEISVDTTTATNLSVFVTWDAADASNSVTLHQAHLKQMG